MSDPVRIESLTPQPFPDLRRVSLILRVSGLPAYGAGSNVINFLDMPQPEEEDQEGKPAGWPATPDVDLLAEPLPANEPPAGHRPPSSFPNLTLSILDQQGNEIASTYVVEHKEPELDFTLHLRTFEPGDTYIACAEMTMNNEVIQVVQVPFELR